MIIEKISHTISILVTNFNLQNQKEAKQHNVRKVSPILKTNAQQTDQDTQYHSLPKD